MYLLEDYKRGLDEKKINLDDDFIKFVRFSRYLVDASGVGVRGMITNNVYLDGLTHRRMRDRLMETFSRVQIVHLHRSLNKKEKAPDGEDDENVFDIMVGVAIGVLARGLTQETGSVAYIDCSGKREKKMKMLEADVFSRRWTALKPIGENFFLVPKDFSSDEEYRSGWGIGNIFMVWQNPGGFPGLGDEDRRVRAEYSVLTTCIIRRQTGEAVRGAGTSCCDRRL